MTHGFRFPNRVRHQKGGRPLVLRDGPFLYVPTSILPESHVTCDARGEPVLNLLKGSLRFIAAVVNENATAQSTEAGIFASPTR